MQFLKILCWIAFPLLLLSFFLSPAQRSARPAAFRTQCLNNLHNIAIALENYQAAYRTLPPAVVRDRYGQPLHSWRVLLLPYLDRQDLYEAYRFDEPWDGPNNRQLHDVRFDIFHCPADDGRNSDTSYVALVSPETIWGDGVPRDWNDADTWDSLSQTLLVAEVANSGIHWMEPRDLEISARAPTINNREQPGISSRHPGVANVSFADGRTKPIADNLSPTTLRALLTIRGGERLSDADY